jgi:hypothetical protein
MPSNIGVMHSFAINLGENFKVAVTLLHTMSGPFLLLPPVEGGPFLPLPPVGGGPFLPLPPVGGGPFLPLPPVGGGPFLPLPHVKSRKVRTSTNLRRKHFTLQQALIH